MEQTVAADAVRRSGPSGRRRLPGPDVVRAVALIGVVVMNYNGYALIDADRRSWGDSTLDDLLDPWRGPLATRFAATFVLVAGVGVTLLTALARQGAAPIAAARWRLVRRGALLYVVGLLLDEIWPGTILVYYGVMFVVAAALFTLRTRWLLAIGATAAAAGWAIELWVEHRLDQGTTTTWLTSPQKGTPSWLLFNAFVNGTHPLFPWLAFLCAGLVLGRYLTVDRWRHVAIGTGIVLAGGAWWAATLLSTTPTRTRAFSVLPSDRGLLYTASALGTALVAYALIDLAAEHLPRSGDPLRRSGQMSLTIYLAHVAVFEVLRRTGAFVPSSLTEVLVMSAAFWIVAIVGATAWHRRYGMGPAERVYRTIGG